MITTEQAAAILAARGVTVRQRGRQYPPTARTVDNWCRSGAIKRAIHVGPSNGPGGTWLIDEAALADFVPPAMGRRKK